MAQKKRVQVQLTPETYELIKQISELGGVSIGGLLGEIIDENKAGLQVILDALLLVKSQDQTSALNRMQALLTDAQQKGLDAQKEMNELRVKHGK